MTIDPFRWLRIAAYVVLLVLSLALLQAAHGQVAVIPFQSPNVQFFDGNGKPLASGCVFTYQAGTTTPQTSYSDSAGTVPNANPIILDGSGRATIWFAMPAYKYIAKSFGGTQCASGSTVVTVDNISEKFFRTDAGNALTATPDPAVSAGLFWYSSTTVGRVKWSDASAIHVVVGADTTDTFSNKTIDTAAPNTIKINGNMLAATAGTATVTIPNSTDTLIGRATADTITGVKTFSAQPLNSQSGSIAGIMTGNCSGVATASTTLALYPLGEISALTCTVAPLGGNGAGAINTTAGTVKNLQVVCGAAGVNASSGVFTVLKNTVATAVTCTVGTGTACGDATHSFTTVVGDRIGIQFTTQGGETLANCSASIERF